MTGEKVARHSTMPESVQRFLVIRLSSIGDIVHALPAVTALAEAYPQAAIDWAVERRHAQLLEGNLHVHRVIQFDTLGWRKSLTSRETIAAVRRGVAALREAHYDAAVDFQGLYKSAVIAWLSRAQERLGFAESWLREPAAGAFYTGRVKPHEQSHVIERNLALVEHLGVPPIDRARWQFPVPENAVDEEYVAGQLTKYDIKDFIIINSGGGWQSKCWAPESYAALMRELTNDFAGDLLLTGSPEEESLITRTLRDSGSPRAKYFPSNITQFIALARRAKLFIGGDTGPLHLAAAVGTPVVGIYGPTDPARNGPFSPDDIAVWNQGPIDYTRRAATAGYIPGIAVETVVAAVHARLARANG